MTLSDDVNKNIASFVYEETSCICMLSMKSFKPYPLKCQSRMQQATNFATSFPICD